ncbi:DUF3037 domain-containing protein [Salinicola sp. CPA57]|uniref:DUF3037 domain-containing protein n=1 Tax=Salinicola sp. CPA57 TaxID=1949080 RepID=UPI000DA1EB8E|nr:DUF3037 domain-containing protein [Salinicola sp. CPA57]
MSAICNYAIVRFQPYTDTGEFANIGVVMLCSDGQFLYRLENKRVGRVTQFFQIQPSLLSKVRKSFQDELSRISSLMGENVGKSDVQRKVFTHLIRPSETILRFSRPGTVKAEKPSEALDKIFKAYVHHDFGTQQDKEAVLARRVSEWLKHLKDRSYVERTLGNELSHVKFSFVWEKAGKTLQVVKPISFDLEDASKITEKGDRWEARMRRLKESDDAPLDTVFICRPPEAEEGSTRSRAYEEVQKELVGRGLVRLVPEAMGSKQIMKAITDSPELH